MQARNAHALLAIAIAALALVAGCGGSIRASIRPGPELPVQALAVYPVQFRWEEPDYRAFELAQLLALEAVARGRYSVFGPGEFRLIRAGNVNPFVGSDLVIGLADRGLSPQAALVVRPSVERRAQSELKQVYDIQGRPRGQERLERARVFARLEVFHSASREVVADVRAEVEVDPLAARDASDPLPELTALLRSMMRATLDALEDRAPGRRSERDPGFAYLWNPKAALEFALEGRPPLRARLAGLDLLEQDLLLEDRLRFFHPAASPAQLASLKRQPAGLFVTEVGAASSAGLRPGDLVVEIDRDPALPQVLARRLRTAGAGGAVSLKVRRGSGLVELALRVP